jgi:signal transduction histidine kinase
MKAGGTGMGLFISHEIMHRISGSLSVGTPADRERLPGWATGAVFILGFDGHSKSGEQRDSGESHGRT